MKTRKLILINYEYNIIIIIYIIYIHSNNRRIPTKDIWSQQERMHYFSIGYKAAIKTQVVSKSSKSSSQYIVCRIKSVNHNKQECDLIDDDQSSRIYTRSFRQIIPLPTLTQVHLSKRLIFKSNTKVLAVYPATTCFYSAKIIKTPKRESTKYTLKFDDDGDKCMEIEAEKIVPFYS